MSENQRTLLLFVVFLLIPVVFVIFWMNDAKKELAMASGQASQIAIASAAEDEYCSPQLKQVLRRVAGACGLVKGARGCRPGDAKTVAALSGDDFNMLFKPLDHRAAIIQFDAESVDLDAPAQALLEKEWGEKRGASFFFVVARASADGDLVYNQMLSQKRAENVLQHLEVKFQDTELRNEVGLLWLGEEYAQLGDQFCEWRRSRESKCTKKDVNRSAFIAWIDCAI